MQVLPNLSFPLLTVDVATSTESFVEQGVSYLIGKIHHILQQKHICVVGLSGGTTPGPIYTKLFQSKEIDWEKVFVCLIDERYIDEKSEYSNTLLVKKAIGDNATAARHFVHPNTTLPIGECISDYDKKVHELFKQSGTLGPDIQVLGMGDDGRILFTLFPPVTSATIEEKNVLHTTTDVNPIRDRITLSFFMLEGAHFSVFFIKGESKFKIWNRMIEAPYNPQQWPAHAVLSKSSTTLVAGKF